MTTKEPEPYSTGTGSDLSGELFRPIDHFTEERRRWIKRRQWIRAMRAIAGKHAVQQESPRVSIVEDAEVKLLLREHRLVGILMGIVLLLAYVTLIGLFPAVCG